MAKPSLTAARLRELLHYDPETGIFTRRSWSGGRLAAGARTGRPNVQGYRETQLAGVKYKEHRLAWLYMTGEWPKHTIDHINGIRDDNRFENLRDVNRFINKQNTRRAPSHSTTGFLGVSRHQSKWQASIRVNNKQLYLGRYETPEDAHAAYLSAKREFHEGNTL